MELTIVEDVMMHVVDDVKEVCALCFLKNLLLSHQNNNNCNNTIKLIKNHKVTLSINTLT